MHCSACSGAVEAALSAVPGVQSAAVSLVMRRATVIADPTAVSPVRRHDYAAASCHPPYRCSTPCSWGMRSCVLHQRSMVRAGPP